MPVIKLCASLVATLVMSAAVPQPTAAQSIPDPPRGDRKPVGLTEPRVSPLPESAWTDVHRQLLARFAPDGRAGNQLKTLNVPEIGP